MIFQRESFSDILAEVLPLARSNFAEVEDDQDRIPFDLDIERYKLSEEMGNLVVYTGRYNGQLMAYSMFFITLGMHSKEVKFALNDAFYIRPEARGRTSTAMLDYCEDQLRNVGVQVIHYRVKDSSDWSTLIARKGFTRIETNWQKWIGE
jgi:GNAT superfamily N-acetyltransferase